MQPVNLPLIQGTNPDTVYLIFPGFDSKKIQGLEYDIDWDEGILRVYFYESGFNEKGDVEGFCVPVVIDQANLESARSMERLQVVEPGELSPKQVGEDEYVAIKKNLEDWKDLQ